MPSGDCYRNVISYNIVKKVEETFTNFQTSRDDLSWFLTITKVPETWNKSNNFCLIDRGEELMQFVLVIISGSKKQFLCFMWKSSETLVSEKKSCSV